MRNMLYFATSAFLLIGASGCKKDKDPGPAKSELLATTTGKKWKLTAATMSIPSMPIIAEINLFDPNNSYDTALQECQKDDLTILYSDKKYQEDEGAQKCDASKPQTIDTGTWSLSENDTKLTIQSNNSSNYFDLFEVTNTPLTIIELSSTRMVLETTLASVSTSPMGVSFSVNLTLTAE